MGARAIRLAEGSIVVGTALGFTLSYSALRRLAAAHGYDGWEAALWPLCVDFVAVSTTALAMALARRRHGPTGETWALAGAAALTSLGGNVLSAWGDPVAAAMHAWAAAIYIGLWHAFFRSVQSERSIERSPERPANHSGVEPQALVRSADDLRERVRALWISAQESGTPLTGSMVARAIGRSEPRARALLAEVRAEQPTANGRRSA